MSDYIDTMAADELRLCLRRSYANVSGMAKEIEMLNRTIAELREKASYTDELIVRIKEQAAAIHEQSQTISDLMLERDELLATCEFAYERLLGDSAYIGDPLLAMLHDAAITRAKGETK